MKDKGFLTPLGNFQRDGEKAARARLGIRFFADFPAAPDRKFGTDLGRTRRRVIHHALALDESNSSFGHGDTLAPSR